MATSPFVKRPTKENPHVRASGRCIASHHNTSHLYYVIGNSIVDNHFGWDENKKPFSDVSLVTFPQIKLIPHNWSRHRILWADGDYFGFIEDGVFYLRKQCEEPVAYKLNHDAPRLVHMVVDESAINIYYLSTNVCYQLIIAGDYCMESAVIGMIPIMRDTTTYWFEPFGMKLFSEDMSTLLFEDKKLENPFNIYNNKLYLNSGQSLYEFDLTANT